MGSTFTWLLDSAILTPGTMARRQIGKANEKKKPSEKAKDNKNNKNVDSLKRSFAAAQGAQPAVKKGDQSLFLTYCKSTVASKDPIAANQALKVLEDYKSMTGEAKKAMITNFFKSGGRKQGLSSLFKQVVSTEAAAWDKGWAGWATPSTIMSWSGVTRGY